MVMDIINRLRGRKSSTPKTTPSDELSAGELQNIGVDIQHNEIPEGMEVLPDIPASNSMEEQVKENFFNKETSISQEVASIVESYLVNKGAIPFEKFSLTKTYKIENEDNYSSFYSKERIKIFCNHLAENKNEAQNIILEIPLMEGDIDHAVSLVTNPATKEAIYHNSYGSQAPKELRDAISAILPDWKLKSNPEQNQFGADNSCQLISRLNGFNNSQDNPLDFTIEQFKEALWAENKEKITQSTVNTGGLGTYKDENGVFTIAESSSQEGIEILEGEDEYIEELREEERPFGYKIYHNETEYRKFLNELKQLSKPKQSERIIGKDYDYSL